MGESWTPSLSRGEALVDLTRARVKEINNFYSKVDESNNVSANNFDF